MKMIKNETGQLHVVPAPAGIDEITDEVKSRLIQAAIDVLPNSYAPYSLHNVGAAVLMSSGRVYTGVNVESASLGCTICAERNAIFSAVAEGERKLLAAAVVGGLHGRHDNYCYPCGICRQVMRDFAKPDEMIILTAKSPDDYRENTLAELLPESFGPESLEE